MTRSGSAGRPAQTGQPGRPCRDPAAVLAASTFSSGLMLLPGALQADARRLYQLLRTIDDLVDEHHPQATHRVEAIERWTQGDPAETPETRTLTRLANRYPLSREAVLDFCKGMRHDLHRNAIETDEDLERYCHYVAGTVGIMLAGLLGTTHPSCEAKMAVLGRAMQRTNILRDIDEDLADGRIYIPRTAIERFGFPAPGAREDLLKDQIARADALYDSGLDAIPLLAHGRRAMSLSATLYREILRQIERDGFGRKPGRATVPARRRQLLASKHGLTFEKGPNSLPNQ
ncbi:MAG TPA: phytoene/squalene synthase family protein [Solirubrobacteraceae bacterium]|nr:phytoene/squalene synthase family protein [Solirubrobacteraceae bacterium]